MTMNTTRRAVLVGTAALPALSLPTFANDSVSDPVFAAIDRHRQAEAAFSAASLKYSRLQDATRDEAGHFINTPEVVAVAAESESICDASDAALTELVAITPTTTAGCAALLRYVEAYVTEAGQGNLFDDFRNIEEPARTLLSRIAGVLAVQS